MHETGTWNWRDSLFLRRVKFLSEATEIYLNAIRTYLQSLPSHSYSHHRNKKSIMNSSHNNATSIDSKFDLVYLRDLTCKLGHDLNIIIIQCQQSKQLWSYCS